MIDGSGAQFLTDFGYVTRRAMVARMSRHGFNASCNAIQDGRVIMYVSGMWHGGAVEVVVPENPMHDHSPALQDVYLVIGLSLSDLYGWYGNC